jgi:hypothetical protein
VALPPLHEHLQAPDLSNDGWLRCESPDDVAAGMPCRWVLFNHERPRSVRDQAPGTVVGVERAADGRIRTVRAREERNGSVRRFHVAGRDPPSSGAWCLIVGER